MSAPARQLFFDAATRELWRVAESGDTAELAAIMSQRDVDVNARNEHGMTALMRAARNGHVIAVRMLLNGGADPNVARNDRFTALALAAFFGHTESVRILIEYGAKTEVVTRSGTSPRMWATARTFTDAARCFETKPEPGPVRPGPGPVRLAPAPAAVPAVHTLKDPPEIWDLVHEVPKGFNARSAFVSRIKSMNRLVAVGAFAGLLLAISCGVAALVLRSSRANNVATQVSPVKIATEVRVDSPVPPVPVQSAVTESPPASADIAVESHVVKKAPVTRQLKARPVVDENAFAAAASREAPQVAVPEIEKPKPRESPVKSEPNATLSPHLITPAKSTAPKGKVIQWP